VIDDNATLAEFLPRLLAVEWIALDTEADSLHAYPEKLCLLQISVPGADKLIDPLAPIDLAPLFQCFRERELILHGADYDLRLLRRGHGFVPHAVFDTMWAARLVGCRQFGLTDLLAKYLGVKLEKGSQKANWARRPLTERMENYARNDTRHLKPLADVLRTELKLKGRLSWLHECCARMVTECAQVSSPDPNTVWRLSGSHHLDRCGLAVLRELWEWREQEAVLANKPPYFILPHDKLVDAAASAAAGRPIEPSLPRIMSPRRRGLLLEAVKAGLAVPPANQPEPLRHTSRRLTEKERRRLAELSVRRDRKAHEIALDPTLIASRAMLISLARESSPRHSDLLNWQRELLGL